MNRRSIKTRQPHALADRLWKRVDRYTTPHNCWPWQGPKDRNGHGVIGLRSGTSTQAHRLAWELTHGEIPDRMLVLHMCDNACCCNPSHLRLGTQSDNIRDAVNKGRLRPHGRPCKAFTLALMLRVKPGTPEYRRLYRQHRLPELNKERRRIAASLEITIEDDEK